FSSLVVFRSSGFDSWKKKLLQFFFAGFYFREAFVSLSPAYSDFVRSRPFW
ncbi:unnamed protein product, partial [Brassica rapa subsp. trilocularis]